MALAPGSAFWPRYIILINPGEKGLFFARPGSFFSAARPGVSLQTILQTKSLDNCSGLWKK
jgi:hypothetical protein